MKYISGYMNELWRNVHNAMADYPMPPYVTLPPPKDAEERRDLDWFLTNWADLASRNKGLKCRFRIGQEP